VRENVIDWQVRVTYDVINSKKCWNKIKFRKYLLLFSSEYFITSPVQIPAVVYVEAVRMYLLTAASNWLHVHPPDDAWEWGARTEWYWKWETEELGEILATVPLFYHESHTEWPGRESGPPRWGVIMDIFSYLVAKNETSSDVQYKRTKCVEEFQFASFSLFIILLQIQIWIQQRCCCFFPCVSVMHCHLLLLLLFTWYLPRRPIHCYHYWSIVLLPLWSNRSCFIHHSCGNNEQRHVVATQERLGEKCQWILPMSICFVLQGCLTCREILLQGINGFISPPKKVVLRIFIALRNLFS
jgi:hypothetical protein